MTAFEALIFGFALGFGLCWLLWRTIFLARAVGDMADMGLINYNEDVIRAYRSDPWD